MKDIYTSIYTEGLPPLILELLETAPMKRLRDIGMHCGCEYAHFPIYAQARGGYSRYTHSIGVAGIVWHFTGELKQTVAALFHDIATPAFAHSIDFMNGDHMTQESTESKTQILIEASQEMMALLEGAGITIEEVVDYHIYPIADNDTPQLSADRLEYTLGNGYLVHNRTLREIQAIYEDISVVSNETNTPELCFLNLEKAQAFVELSLINAYWFVSDEDRFAMQYLADLMRKALQEQVITPEALLTTEEAVIAKIKASRSTALLWEQYTNLSEVATSSTPLETYCIKVAAKMRYIDPLVMVDGMPKRITCIDEAIKKRIETFLKMDFNKWVFAK